MYQSVVDEALDRAAGDVRACPRAWLLGVTPEIAALDFGRGELRATDSSPGMVHALWAGPPDDVQIDDWRTCEVEPASCDVVLGDGVLHLVRFPGEQGEVLARAARALKPGGLLALRLFVPSPRPERIEHVWAAWDEKHVRTPSALKLRLWSALQRRVEEGISLAEVWSAASRHARSVGGVSDPGERTRRMLEALSVYRDAPGRYHLVTIEQAAALVRSASGGALSVERVVESAGYELAERCPILIARKAES